MILRRTILLLSLLVLLPAMVYGGEECAMVGGICRDACAADEYAEVGAFLDCTEKQECCVKKEEQPSRDIQRPGETKRKDRE